ncbi:unnamed protein product [Urochloa decumbens]|uniref:DUF1618 domain-containing protein n=1 Tax=Urochloa decumbens TaxID=240449 RepID=A0ABC9HI39_9POAL
MIRRFVNLVVAKDYGSLSYSLHRLDVANLLFYPSTAAAEAANNASDNKDCHGGGKPSTMGTTLRRLPPATTRFQQYPPPSTSRRWPPPHSDDMFVLLSPRTGEGCRRILHHAGGGSHRLIHDADADAAAGATSTAPSIGVPMRCRPLALSFPGAAGGLHESRIYVMRSDIESPAYYSPNDDDDDGGSVDFVVRGGGKGGASRGHGPPPRCLLTDWPPYVWILAPPLFVVLDFNEHCPKWRRLPPPPCAGELGSSLGTWLGFSPKDPNHLCSADLSAAIAGGGGMANGQAPPKLQHVWEDFNPPPMEESAIVLNPSYPEYVLRRMKCWTAVKADLVNLGSGRFCNVKVFMVERSEWVGSHEKDTCLTRRRYLLCSPVWRWLEAAATAEAKMGCCG